MLDERKKLINMIVKTLFGCLWDIFLVAHEKLNGA